MPRISAGSVEEHREQVHRRVFEAFADLLATSSFDAVTMAQIAAAAGLGRTAIYHHFADKEAVVVAFATHETDRYLADLAEHLDGVEGPRERLRSYVRHQLEAGQRFHLGLGPRTWGALSPEGLAQVRVHVVAVEQVLRDLLDDGVDAGVFAVPDPAATMSLIHACLSQRGVAPAQVEHFVLHALTPS